MGNKIIYTAPAVDTFELRVEGIMCLSDGDYGLQGAPGAVLITDEYGGF